MHRHHLLRGVSACALTFAVLSPAQATHTLPTIDVAGQHRAPARDPARPARAAGPVAARPAPTTAPVTAPSPIVSRWSPTLPDGRPAFVEKWQLPNTVASVTRKQIEQQVNIVDTEDAVKYMPSLFVRKRNNGDTQAVLQTRTYGVSSSARSLVYADDLLLTALIGNDNNIGAPRWGLVAPEEIDRVDFLYGPFSAQYPGNSMGGVLKITTRMPEKLEVTAKETVALQDFSLWGTSNTFWTNNFAATAGDKINDFSWFVSGNWLRGTTQPLTYVTLQSTYGYPGAYFATSKLGFPAEVLGSTGNLANDQVNGKVKLAYDITPTIRATYQLGFWSNDGTSIPQNYLVSGYGPFFGRAQSNATNPFGLTTTTLQSFASGYYRVQEKMLVNNASVRSNSGGPFDFEISASHFNYLQSNQRAPFSGAYPAGYTQTGRNAVYTGTYWTLLDLKGIVRPDGALAGHDISFGLHGDQFHLNNPTWLTLDWTTGTSTAYAPASIGNGTTRTQALWAQDAWKIRDDLKFTVGIRGEHWQASDGYNQSLGNLSATGLASTAQASSLLPIYQPNLYHTRFSPKGSLQWIADPNWTITGSIGLANRFPTAKELYNLSTLTTSNQNVNPNPNLRPEVSLYSELAFERRIKDGSVRLSLFDEQVRDFIFSQNVVVPGTTQLVSTPTNIDRIRNSGVELAWIRDNVLIKGLEFSGSVTWLNSRVISDSTWVPTQTNPAVLSSNLDWWTAFNVYPYKGVSGKTVPNVPDWRWTAVATYRPDDHWAFTLAARYQGRMWTVLSNNDIAHGVYQSFDRFFVVDTKIHYKYDDRWSFDFGVDNIGNYKYFLFHPFPQRTFVTSAKYEFGTGKGAPGIFYGGDASGLPDLTNWFQPVAFAID
jgi:iron complex outermembrane receptor protein